jgi:hypothetical protein
LPAAGPLGASQKRIGMTKVEHGKSAKHGGHKHEAHKHKKGAGAIESAAAPGLTEAPLSGGYADGTPLDKVQFLEAKLILKPDRFTSVQSFRDFGKLVQKTAKQVDVGFIADVKADERPEIREIVFLDTSDFRLYNNAYILRRRIRYVDGFPAGEPEVVFKFRHPDEKAATALDMRPEIAGHYDIKFKVEALPLRDAIGGYRLLYSHNCQFGISQAHEGNRSAISTLTRVFPQLQQLKLAEDEHVSLVNGGIVEEVLLTLGRLDFGGGATAKCDVALWRTRGEHLPLVGEFSFQLKFADKREVAQAQRKKLDQFYISLQNAVADWLAIGVTKTAMVYRLGGAMPAAHE